MLIGLVGLYNLIDFVWIHVTTENGWNGVDVGSLLVLILEVSKSLFLIASVGIYKYKEWARVVGIVCSIIILLSYASKILFWLCLLLVTGQLHLLLLLVLSFSWVWILMYTGLAIFLTRPNIKILFRGAQTH
jgi:hypothetical protein